MLSLYQRSLAATSDTESANADPARANAGALGGGDCCAAEMDGAITQSTRATVLIAVCSRVWLRDGSLRGQLGGCSERGAPDYAGGTKPSGSGTDSASPESSQTKSDPNDPARFLVRPARLAVRRKPATELAVRRTGDTRETCSASAPSGAAPRHAFSARCQPGHQQYRRRARRSCISCERAPVSRI